MATKKESETLPSGAVTITAPNKQIETSPSDTVTVREKVETQMAGPLSAVLITVATFALTAMGLVNTPGQSFVDEIFMVLGLGSLLSAARIIDVMFDKFALDVTDRFKLIGGGYFLFCLVVGAMSFAILLLYASKSSTGVFPWITFAPSLLTGACIIGMLMSHRGSQAWFIGTLLAFVVFIVTCFLR
jgi:hypothetical protein